MKRLLGRRLTYANVVSTLCLFMLLGGVAYAGTKLAAHSVGTRQLKNGAVTTRKIAKSARKKLKGARGATGPQGERGLPGLPGLPGSSGPLVVDASATDFAIDSTARDVPLSGNLSWTPPAGKVGLLLASATLTLATTTETPGTFCIPQLRILDNGHTVASLGSFVEGGPGTTTPHQLDAEGVAAPVALLEPGVPHTITLHYAAEFVAGCASGSKFDDLRVAVAPLGQ
jgi:hypothetical protein